MRTANTNTDGNFNILAWNQKLRDGYRPPLSYKNEISKLIDPLSEDKHNLFKQEVGAAIKRVRLAKKLTQAEVADRAGIKRTNYLSMEKGRENMTIVTLYRIAEALDCEVQVLFTPRGFKS